VPGPPGVLRIEEIGDTWVRLLWSKAADHNSPILYYTIQTRHFWALNEDDWRNASTSPVVSPTDVAGYGGRNGEIIITWNPVQPWYFYGKKFGYIVAFKPHDAYDWWYETISDPETRRYVHRDSYFIPTEEDFQVREFQVKIKSFNVKGDGPYSLTKVIYYPRDEPPTDVYARPVSSTEAVVWWLPVVDTGTGLQQYIEGYQVRKKTGYIYGKVYITGWHFMDFPMPQFGDYELMVRGRYEGGDGPVRMISIKGKHQYNKRLFNMPLVVLLLTSVMLFLL
ncbi:hypothetical protein XENOCAPTIV_004480, partial [Xenoophorus captivus]